MRRGFFCGAALLGLATMVAAEPPVAGIKALQPPPGTPVPPAPEPTPVIKLAVTIGAPTVRALKYTLLPDPLDLTTNNAAPLWIRAGVWFQGPHRQLVEGPYKGRNGPAGTSFSNDGKLLPLKELPKEEIRSFLAHFATALRLADQAAHCDHCDWEFPPFTLQNSDFVLDEIQNLRSIAALLQTRCRLELSEGRFDDAMHTLQTGFALARDIGKGNTLIQNLVGIAVGSIMFGNVQEWMQAPDSPNLYWALTDLPRPLVDTNSAMRGELTTLLRSFPQLRELARDSDKGALSEEEINRVAAELFKTLGNLEGAKISDWQQKLATAALAIKVFPEARKYLLEQGRKPELVDAMPPLQVVLLYYVDQYDQVKDETLKWMNVAPWEARAGLDKAAKDAYAEGVAGNLLVKLLVPAVNKVYEARVRIEYTADYLRCAEALRMYAATHDGKAPAKWEDVKLPLSPNPYTGQSFDKFYKVEADGTGVFEVPPPPPIAMPSFGRRFELVPKH